VKEERIGGSSEGILVITRGSSYFSIFLSKENQVRGAEPVS